MIKIKFVAISIILISISFAGSITGKITSSETNKPLPGVNIYLSGSTIGTASANDGSFVIRSIPAGKYTVVVSMIGYERKTFEVLIKNNSAIELDVDLEEKIYKTDDVNVTALTPDEWLRLYEIFKKEFFGLNEFSEYCVIHNKEILDFYEVDGVLTAATDSVLKISNEALGYHIDIEFDKFIYNPYQKVVVFNIYPHFKEMALEGDDLAEVIRSRREVYLGSFKHLLSEMARYNSLKFSFQLYKTSYFSGTVYSSWEEKKLSHFKCSFYQDSTFYVMESDSSFRAVFQNEDLYKNGIVYAKAPHLIFDSFGNILNGGSFVAFGDWRNQRFSMQLPRNFKIDLFEEIK